MNLLNVDKHQITPETLFRMIPELEIDYSNNIPFNWNESKIELWHYAIGRITDYDTEMERYSILCIPVVFDKEGNSYTFCGKRSIREQIIYFDNIIGGNHFFCGPDFLENDGENFKVVQIFQEFEHNVYGKSLSSKLIKLL